MIATPACKELFDCGPMNALATDPDQSIRGRLDSALQMASTRDAFE
jgi:hypothetical protein